MITSQDLLPLSALRTGQTAVVEFVEGESAEATRLQSLGFVAGALVRMVCCGCGSCSVLLGESRLVLRGESLKQIFVAPV